MTESTLLKQQIEVPKIKTPEIKLPEKVRMLPEKVRGWIHELRGKAADKPREVIEDVAKIEDGDKIAVVDSDITKIVEPRTTNTASQTKTEDANETGKHTSQNTEYTIDPNHEDVIPNADLQIINKNIPTKIETKTSTPEEIAQQQSQIIDFFNNTSDPEVLNKASLEVAIPLGENVRISLGEKVDEIMRRRGLDLAKLVEDGKYSRLVLLDASARPILGLARAACSGGLSQNGRTIPQALFLNIGKEKIYSGLWEQTMPESLEEFKSRWPEEFIQQLTDVLDKSHIANDSKVLIVDDVRGTGASVELTSRILKWFRPDLEVDKFKLVDSQADKDALMMIYDRHVPWRKMQKDPTQSLVADDVRENDLSTFVSKPQKASVQKQALEYRRRLYHYFKGLYDNHYSPVPLIKENQRDREQARYQVFLRETELSSKVGDNVSPIIFHREGDVGYLARAAVITQDQAHIITERIRIAADHNQSRLIFTPEYSFFSEPQVAQPITFRSDGNITGQEAVVDAIKQIRKVAQQKGKTIVLGSVCEAVTLTSGKDITLNTTLIIQPDGSIHYRRKNGDQYSSLLRGDKWHYLTNDSLTDGEREEIENLTLGSISSYPIQGNDEPMKASVLVCVESDDQQAYARVPDDTSLLIIPASGLNNPHPSISLEDKFVSFRSLNSIRAMLLHGKKRGVTIAINDERKSLALIAKFDADGNIVSANYVS